MTDIREAEERLRRIRSRERVSWADVVAIDTVLMALAEERQRVTELEKEREIWKAVLQIEP